MSLVTAADAQARGVGLDLSSPDLQTLLDREEAEIVRRFGANYGVGVTVSETVYPAGRSLYLKRRLTAVTSITEYLYPGDAAPTTRAAADYIIWGSEGRIERSGASVGWGRVVTVVYTPADDTDLRREVLLDLVRASTETAASTAETIEGLGYRISGGTAGGARAAEQARAAAYARLGGWLS